jgi:hypothetical protein
MVSSTTGEKYTRAESRPTHDRSGGNRGDFHLRGQGQKYNHDEGRIDEKAQDDERDPDEKAQVPGSGWRRGGVRNLHASENTTFFVSRLGRDAGPIFHLPLLDTTAVFVVSYAQSK